MPVGSIHTVQITPEGGASFVADCELVPNTDALICDIPDKEGVVQVDTLGEGMGSAHFSRPVGGMSHAEITLSRMAAIRGRVTHDGQGVIGASVWLVELTGETGDQEGRMVGGEPCLPCELVRGPVLSGAEGVFEIAAIRIGEFRIVARKSPFGAHTSAPLVLRRKGEDLTVDAPLAPGSTLEVRSLRSDVGRAAPTVSIVASSGLADDRETGPPEYLARFDSLPAGMYQIVDGDVGASGRSMARTAHIQLDGTPRAAPTVVIGDSSTYRVALSLGEGVRSASARLYFAACGPILEDEVRGNTNHRFELLAGEPGPHTLVVQARMAGGRECTFLAHVDIRTKLTECTVPSVEFKGNIECAVNDFGRSGKVYCRSSGRDGWELFAPLELRDVHKKAAKQPTGRFAYTGAVPAGVSAIVGVGGRGELELLAKDVLVSDSVQTKIQL